MLQGFIEKTQNSGKEDINSIIKDYDLTLKKVNHSFYYKKAETDLIIEPVKLI